MLEELGRSGYEELSVDAALRAAGVPRPEFETEFGGKDKCLFAAYEHLTGQIVERTAAVCASTASWPERVRAGLTELLTQAAAEPRLAQAVTRSFPGIRPDTYQCYVDLLARFTPLMVEGRDYSGVAEELPAEVELLAVGAAEAIIFSEVDAGRTERLPEMVPEILFSVLVPFMGPERAADEMREAAAAR
ncbi:MAG TPA: hypothetical protein VFX85_02365 [Solirubrobacterales bacterium]|nr:hypothetical protein [Solirubrobacterales bacterium]